MLEDDVYNDICYIGVDIIISTHWKSQNCCILPKAAIEDICATGVYHINTNMR